MVRVLSSSVVDRPDRVKPKNMELVAFLLSTQY